MIFNKWVKLRESSGLTPDQKEIKQQLLLQFGHLEPSQMLPLPENPSLYFRMDVPGIIMVPMNKLHNIRARPEGIKNALIMMYANSIGKSTLPKRVPISVTPMPNGDYEVYDGNSTYNIAKQSGWKQMPAIVHQ